MNHLNNPKQNISVEYSKPMSDSQQALRVSL